MMIEIFGSIENVYALTPGIDIAGGRLYVFLKEKTEDGKVRYEYLGSMLSTLEDNSTAFMNVFLETATHYALPSALGEDLMILKETLDSHDRALVFEGMDSI